jgi:hypothetical protein
VLSELVAAPADLRLRVRCCQGRIVLARLLLLACGVHIGKKYSLGAGGAGGVDKPAALDRTAATDMAALAWL